VRRGKSGGHAKIRPAELNSGIEDDPVVAFDWPRADLDGGAREFVIGLLSTTCCQQVMAWQDWWEKPPDAATLDACFAPVRPRLPA
jgi:CRISPR system Cascade subunit CasA